MSKFPPAGVVKDTETGEHVEYERIMDGGAIWYKVLYPNDDLGYDYYSPEDFESFYELPTT